MFSNYLFTLKVFVRVGTATRNVAKFVRGIRPLAPVIFEGTVVDLPTARRYGLNEA